MESQPERATVGSVLVVGAGIAGIQASLDLADSGFQVHLLESSPAIGGTMAQLDKTFPTNDCSMCILSPKVVECARHINIELHTLAEVEAISGEAGSFTVTLRNKARLVDPAGRSLKTQDDAQLAAAEETAGAGSAAPQTAP